MWTKRRGEELEEPVICLQLWHAFWTWHEYISREGWMSGNDVPVKGTSEHEVVIAGKFAHARVELAIVDQAAGFAYHEERKDNPEGN